MKKQKQVVKLNESQLRNIVSKAVNRIVNESYSMNQGYGGVEIYSYLKALASGGDKDAEMKLNDFIKNHHYEICEQLAWMFEQTYKEKHYTDSFINNECMNYIKRIEKDDEEYWLRHLGERYLRLMDNDEMDFIDPEELGLCLYEEMKKYTKKYREKLDKANKRRKELKGNINNELSESKLKRIVSESVKRVLKESDDTKMRLFSIKAWMKGIHQDIDGLEIAIENNRPIDKLLPQFIQGVRFQLEQMEEDLETLY